MSFVFRKVYVVSGSRHINKVKSHTILKQIGKQLYSIC